MEWNELALGMVLVNNIGNGADYINRIENLVYNKKLSWTPHGHKERDYEENKKVVNTIHLKNIKRWGWNGSEPTEEEKLHESLFNTIDKDLEQAYFRYIKEYQVPFTQKENYEVLKYYPGSLHVDHVDDGLFMCRRLSAVYYMNEDFSGGDLHFPKVNVTITPKKNQLLLFPSNYIYNHEVMPIKDGIRYAMVQWFA